MSNYKNGSIIGVDNTPTISVASGVWDINTVRDAVDDGIWPGAAATLALASSDFDGTNTDSFNFASKSIGTAAADRILITVVVWRGESSARTLDTFTIGGAGGNQRLSVSGGSNSDMAIWTHAIAAGTSATFDMTFSGNLERMGWACYETHGLVSETPTDTASDISGDASLGIDCEAGGVVAVGGYWEGTAITFTNIDDSEPPAWKESIDATNDRGAASGEAFASAQTGLAISTSMGAPSITAFGAAAFR